jgi:lipopolysaccharide biosynthesis regulator YciM
LDLGTWERQGASAKISLIAQTTRTDTGRSLADPSAVAREARRLVALERQYRCQDCGCERTSWTRIRNCPECGEAFHAAVIRRAALAA